MTKKLKNRRKAASIRAIKAYWFKEAKEANADFKAWLDEWADINNRPASDFEEDVERLGYEYSKDALLKDAENAFIDALIRLRNAVNRYRMAIPKNGIGAYKGGKKMQPVWLCAKKGYDIL
jgi:hypothetical protein